MLENSVLDSLGFRFWGFRVTGAYRRVWDQILMIIAI